ncbi:MAG TPA: S9 family peptidase, partial [Chloroflexota bacterium]|nr:S9 family peptidase [Chloroflexota bacterium]
MPESPLNIEALVSAGAISGIDVSPDGASVVFSSSAGGRPRLYVRDIGTDGITRRLDTGTESATQPKWSPRGDVIAFLQDVGGDENYRICVVDPAGGEVRDLTRAPGKLHENYSWSADGTRLAFVSNRDGQFDVYYVDVDTAEVKRVTNHLSVHHSPEFSRVGDAISYCSNRTDLRGNWDTFVTTFSDGRERQITRHKGEADEMSYYAGQRPHWAPGDGRVLVSSSVRGTYDITSIDPRTLKQTWLIEGPLEETNAQWAPDGSRLAYIVNQDGNQVIHIMRPDTGEAWPVSQLSGSSGVIGMRGKGADYRWTADGESIVYGHHSATEPGSVWAVAAGGGEPRLLYSSMPEGLDRSALVQPSVVSYESFDGRSISGLLFRPLSASVGPGIIMPHGGPTGQSTNAWGPLIQYMVSLGYVVFEPNFRGSTGRGREFQWLNRNDWGGGDLRDVVAAADWLESQGIASGMGIMGGSYGGYMTLSGVTQYPDRWLAAVSIFGIANLVTMYRTAREDMRHFQARNIGTPDENPAFYRERSPLNHVERITAPLLILQGERDARVPRL